MPHRLRFVALPLAALMLSLATPAAAQPAPAAGLVVVLHGGASLRGALVENVDGPATENAEAGKAFRTTGYVSIASGLALGGVGLAPLLGRSGPELQIDQGEPELGLGKRWWLTPRGLTF